MKSIGLVFCFVLYYMAIYAQGSTLVDSKKDSTNKMMLVKNANSVLPFGSGIKNIVVIGPLADSNGITAENLTLPATPELDATIF